MATAATDLAELARGSMTPLPYRVARKRRENHDNWTLELEPVADAIEPIGPGQFDMLYAFGVGEVPISTSGDVEKSGTTLVHTIRAVCAVTNAPETTGFALTVKRVGILAPPQRGAIISQNALSRQVLRAGTGRPAVFNFTEPSVEWVVK